MGYKNRTGTASSARSGCCVLIVMAIQYDVGFEKKE